MNTYDQIDTAIADNATYISDTANSHDVTKAQVGLASVYDTSDADKPVSTAVQAAIGAAAALHIVFPIGCTASLMPMQMIKPQYLSLATVGYVWCAADDRPWAGDGSLECWRGRISA